MFVSYIPNQPQISYFLIKEIQLITLSEKKLIYIFLWIISKALSSSFPNKLSLLPCVFYRRLSDGWCFSSTIRIYPI